MGFLAKQFPTHILAFFYIKTTDFREFANPNKTVKTQKTHGIEKKNNDDLLRTDLKI